MDEHPTSATSIGKRKCAKLPKQSWWINTHDLEGFIEHLHGQGFEMPELLKVIGKPWKWTPEFAEWKDGIRKP